MKHVTLCIFLTLLASIADARPHIRFVELLDTTNDLVVLREGCGGAPWTHVKWSVLVPKNLRQWQKWNKDNWTVRKFINHPDCVTLTGVSIEGAADRFTQSKVTVHTNATPDYWTYELSNGTATKTDSNLYITSDGLIGDAVLTINFGETSEEFLVPYVQEPVCDRYNSIDCQGYVQRSSQEFIYYGEEDDTVVTWELGILVYASHRKYGDDVAVGILDEITEENVLWDQWQDKVKKYNEIYARSGVHIEFVLKKMYYAHWHNTTDLRTITTGYPIDISLAYGYTYPGTCGVASPSTRFIEGKPPSSMSACSIYTDLHEIGHSVGLAHGPQNQWNQAEGYIFPEFGHGWNDICGSYDDLMSYGSQGVFHSNSKLACFEASPSEQTNSAGDRQWSDTAYSLNRVRYDVSLIHDEHKKELKMEELNYIQARGHYITDEVID